VSGRWVARTPSGDPPSRYYHRVLRTATLGPVMVDSRKVLVIEDDADIRAIMADMLSSEGYSVVEAADGVEGLERAREQLPDVILLDLMMPRMDGWAFREAQQADANLADIPVVVVSAAMSDRLHAVPAAAHLHKPFDVDELLGIVGRCASRA